MNFSFDSRTQLLSSSLAEMVTKTSDTNNSFFESLAYALTGTNIIAPPLEQFCSILVKSNNSTGLADDCCEVLIQQHTGVTNMSSVLYH